MSRTAHRRHSHRGAFRGGQRAEDARADRERINAQLPAGHWVCGECGHSQDERPGDLTNNPVHCDSQMFWLPGNGPS